MPTTQQILDDILRREGGYVDHPSDRGGPTNHGITLATLADYRGRPATIDELKALSEIDAELIYRTLYIYPFESVADAELKSLVVDCAVNHGVGRATQWLQEAVGVRPDGQIGAISRAALGALDSDRSKAVYRAILRKRAQLYARIVAHDVIQAVFLEGWINRLCEFI